jgi:hypothetical protein
MRGFSNDDAYSVGMGASARPSVIALLGNLVDGALLKKSPNRIGRAVRSPTKDGFGGC